MDFSLSDQIKQRISEVGNFAELELVDNVFERDDDGSFAIDLWNKCAEYGIQGMASVKPYGGSADKVNLLDAVLIMEALGKACKDGGLLLGLSAQMWTVQLPILHFGSEMQKKKFLKPLATGEKMACHALTERESGSDAFAMSMRADKVSGGYVLNGVKRFITLGPLADYALVFASTNLKLGKWGISAFIVEAESSGYKRGPVMEKMGLRTVPFGEIILEDCFVPEENMLGKEGSGFGICNHSLDYDRSCMLTGKLGAMQRQLEECIEYAKQRKQFGKKIADFQAVSHRLVDMRLRIESARMKLYQVAWKKDNNLSTSEDAAMAKLLISEAYMKNSIEAIRIFGGNGYLKGNSVEKDLRDAVGGLLYAGTSDVQRNILSKLMGIS